MTAAILTGHGENFCAGYDLQFLEGVGNVKDDNGCVERETALRLSSGPMGPTHLLMSKPVIAAVEGYAVAGKHFVLIYV